MSSTNVGDARGSLRDEGYRKGANFLQEVPDFSLVLGGPLFQLLRKSRLGGDALELLHRRIVVSILLTWFPLLLLSAIGTRVGSGAQISFLRDIEVHARFLVDSPDSHRRGTNCSRTHTRRGTPVRRISFSSLWRFLALC